MKNILFLAAALVCMTGASEIVPTEYTASAQQSTGVNGRNVTRVNVAGGSFREARRGVWAEYDRNGKVVFTFTETARDDWSVYLNDASRNVQLQLDLHRKKVRIGNNGGSRSDLYNITSSTRRAPVAQPQPRPQPNPQPRSTARPSRPVNAGPIWNQADAEVKCPVVAHAVNGKWTGGWRTTRQGQMSVCQIASR